MSDRKANIWVCISCSWNLRRDLCCQSRSYMFSWAQELEEIGSMLNLMVRSFWRFPLTDWTSSAPRVDWPRRLGPAARNTTDDYLHVPSSTCTGLRFSSLLSCPVGRGSRRLVKICYWRREDLEAALRRSSFLWREVSELCEVILAIVAMKTGQLLTIASRK